MLRIYYYLFLFWHPINLYGFRTAGDFFFRSQDTSVRSQTTFALVSRRGLLLSVHLCETKKEGHHNANDRRIME